MWSGGELLTGTDFKKGVNDMMKSYQVFYFIKANRREYLHHMFVMANNAREACQVCKQQVKEQTGRNAFRPTTTAPSVEELEQLRKIGYYVVD